MYEDGRCDANENDHAALLRRLAEEAVREKASGTSCAMSGNTKTRLDGRAASQ
jgi:hypothetical protein